MVAQRDPYDSPAIRAFAAELKAWREDAGLSKLQLAETLGYTPQLIGQFESCRNIPSKRFAEDTDTFFKTNGVFVRHWNLINETRHLAALPPGFPEFVAREAEASRMYVFEPIVIKGLFQTRDYACELLKSGRSPEDVEELASERMERQKILDGEKPPCIVAIFDEPTLRRMIGGRDVMRGQIERLVELAQRPNITIQMRGQCTGLEGSGTELSDGYKRKLIEVTLPLDDVTARPPARSPSATATPSTLHLWWARRPSAAHAT